MKSADEIDTYTENLVNAQEVAESFPAENKGLTDKQMEKLADVVLSFSQAMCGVTLHDYELEFGWRLIYSVLVEDAEEITALFSRQSGKTETTAVCVCGLLVMLPVLAEKLRHDRRIAKFAAGLWVGVYAPHYHQSNIMFRRMKARMYSQEAKSTLLDPDIDIDLTKKNVIENLRLPNGSFVHCGTAAPQAKIEGETFHLIICEEAQDIDRSVLRSSIHPMAAACITGDSWVPVDDGRFIQLRDIGVTQKTCCFDENLKYCEKYPLRHIDSGEQECIRMQLNSGKEITGTLDHPVIFKPRAYPRKPKWEELQHIEVGSQIAVPRSLPMFGSNSIGRAEARILGMLVGDGSYHKDCSPAFAGEDAELHEFLEQWVISKGGRIKEQRFHTASKGRRFSEIRCLSDVGKGSAKGKNPVIELLRNGGIYGQTKDKKRVPLSIWTAPKEEVAAFIGGLVDTDGGVNVTHRRCTVDIAQSNREILEEVSRLYLKFGIHSRLRECEANGNGYAKKGSKYFRLDVSDKDSIEIFIKEIELLVRRKADALRKASGVLSSRRSKRRASVIVGSGDSRHAVELDNDLVWERVVCVERVGKRQVFDIEMPDPTHNFVANGIVVHNTAGTLIKIGTPSRERSDFYEACRRNKRSDVVRGKTRSKKRRHYEFDYTVAQRNNPRYRKYVEKEKERLGEASDDFRMKYRLHWLLERGMFVSPDMFEECGIREDDFLVVTKGNRTRKKQIKFRRSRNLITYDPTTPKIVAAIDVGKENSTIVTIGRPFWDMPIGYADGTRFPLHIWNWLELQGDNHEEQHPQILGFLANYRISDVIIDATGKGDPVYTRIAADLSEHDITVHPFIFSASSKDRGYKALLQEINSKRLTYPAGAAAARTQKWKNFHMQMTDLRKSWRGTTMVVQKDVSSDEARDDFCMSSDMEILAENGWVGIDSLKTDDRVCCYDPKSKSLAYSRPSRVIVRNIKSSEKMVRISSDTVDQLVTDNHKVIYEKNTRGSHWVEEVGTAGSLFSRLPIKTSIPVKACQEIPDESGYTDDEIRLAGWMITEGWTREGDGRKLKYSVAQSEKNPEFLEEIEGVCHRLGLEYSVTKRKDRVHIYQFRLASTMFFNNLLEDGVHRVPRKMLSRLSSREFRVLLETLMKGDGDYRSGRKTWTYYTKSRGLAEDVHEVAFKAGKRSRIVERDLGYYVYIHSTTRDYLKEVSYEAYEGRVWCVTVPSGFIVCRRNGKMSITGNCDSLMMLNWLVNIGSSMEVEEADNMLMGRISRLAAGGDIRGAVGMMKRRLRSYRKSLALNGRRSNSKWD